MCFVISDDFLGFSLSELTVVVMHQPAAVPPYQINWITWAFFLGMRIFNEPAVSISHVCSSFLYSASILDGIIIYE
jgi:hypothetical protein